MKNLRGQVATQKSSISYCHHGQVATHKPSVSYRNLRGQVATEFFIYAGVFLILVIAAVVVVNFTQTTELNLLEANIAKENGQLFSDAIHLSLRGGSGFTYMLEYPKNILGYPYYIYFNDSKGLVFINWINPKGNFSYVYSTTPFSGGSQADFKLCPNYPQFENNKLSSNTGKNILNITNDGTKLIFRQECGS